MQELLRFDLQFFADEAGDKTEEPTAKKLDDARKEGQVAKSREIANCLGLLAVFLILRFWAGRMGNQFLGVFHDTYSRIHEILIFWNGEMPVTDLWLLLRRAVLSVILILLPMLIIGFIIAFVSDLIQVQWKPTGKTLQPKLSKINPISGFKKIFSMNSLVELIKSLAKIGLVAVISYNFLKDCYGIIFHFYEMPLMQGIALIGKTVTDLGIRISAIYIVIAGADFGYQKWKFHRDMKMTKQEVKDEYKQSEGDPQIKGKIRQKMMEVSRRRMMQALPQADVVITNPTHYAVAVKYDPQEREAPYVLAKGEGYLAQRIKEVAKEHGIELVENKPVARMLYHNVEVGESIPPELYQAVAEILAFVYHLQGKV